MGYADIRPWISFRVGLWDGMVYWLGSAMIPPDLMNPSGTPPHFSVHRRECVNFFSRKFYNSQEIKSVQKGSAINTNPNASALHRVKLQI
jgi:hypothetical protein